MSGVDDARRAVEFRPALGEHGADLGGLAGGDFDFGLVGAVALHLDAHFAPAGGHGERSANLADVADVGCRR